MDTTLGPRPDGVFDEVSKFLHSTVQQLAHFFGINPGKNVRAGRENLQQIDLKGKYFIGTKLVG
ncbi:TPA: hypothetical protein OW432_003583 [Pseudomonas aeruginosa]|uniref:hypothetical protein n=1 Tax=Pseudomonas aeruginosa TaxID=287 RepID=UPI000FD19B46|nr:hypothetical protein [Pseudomonas aeruginosa]MCO3326926.1 hypothetical protein [Pseudomonas aeruginosa]RUI13432.1 hypothetical protein IPC448_25030 [Pseudomonas aeruginosa]HBO6118721.1 hypothetical protein [Pseudomonas aeruginosa]HCE9913599.1 hypothetical protein [Pseudomonas aeruginosa]HCW0470355.1 hypothetical protein [Pseudomonas aeruginosa]